jgi:hypothetical protein
MQPQNIPCYVLCHEELNCKRDVCLGMRDARPGVTVSTECDLSLQAVAISHHDTV